MGNILNKQQKALQEIQLLRARYIRELPSKTERIVDLWQMILDEPIYTGLLQEMQRQSHILTGAGSTFGCNEISDIALAINNICQEILASEKGLAKKYKHEMDRLITAMQTASCRYLDQIKNETFQATPSQDNETDRCCQDLPLIYLLDADAAYGELLARAVASYGYETLATSSLDELASAIQERKPHALVMDIMTGNDQNTSLMAGKRYAEKLDIPVIYLSIRDDLQARLDAVRAGAVQYFTKPVEITKIVSVLDNICYPERKTTGRVLIIDDDVELTEYCAANLELYGVETLALDTGQDLIEHLGEFRPDVVVLDIELPDINGLELAAIIRQIEEYRHIPIVFLTSHYEDEMRFTGLRLGADDYITKPVKIELLARSLLARIKRAREMRKGHLELEKALRDLDFMKKALNEHAIVSMADADGNITYINDKFTEITGFTQEELLGYKYRTLASGSHDQIFFDHLWNTISSGQMWQGTIHNITRDGNDFDAYTTILPQLDDLGKPRRFISIQTDITRLNTLTREMQDDAERFSLAMMTTNSGMWEWNLETNSVIYSDSWLQVMGYDAVDTTRLSWPELIHPDDFDDVFSKFMSVIETSGRDTFKTRHRVKNKQSAWDWVSESAKVIKRDHAGHAMRIVGMTHLINDRVRLEQQQEEMQKQLIQASKMESIGRLSAGIAHDFNNLLGGMLGYAELSNEVVYEDEREPVKLKKYLAEIMKAGTRAKELISQMLIFSRLSTDKEDTTAVPVLVPPIVEEIMSLLSSALPPSIRLKLEVTDDDLVTVIQPVQLHQVLVSLCVNAKDAMNEHGEITITLSKHSGGGVCDSCHQAYANDHIEISVTDTGNGIPHEQSANIFKTGMGLSIVHGVVHALDGHVLLESEEKSGTSVRILLPAAQQETSTSGVSQLSAPVNKPASDMSLDNLTIMLVDDEHAICSMLTELLRMRGASVMAFTSPHEAIRAFENNPYAMDLLISDQIMPSIFGLDMARRMQLRRPDLPVIICTGFSDELSSETAAIHNMGYIEKPIDLEKMTDLIFELTRNLNKDSNISDSEVSAL